jgi:hypothetical protein
VLPALYDGESENDGFIRGFLSVDDGGEVEETLRKIEVTNAF